MAIRPPVLLALRPVLAPGLRSLMVLEMLGRQLQEDQFTKSKASSFPARGSDSADAPPPVAWIGYVVDQDRERSARILALMRAWGGRPLAAHDPHLPANAGDVGVALLGLSDKLIEEEWRRASAIYAAYPNMRVLAYASGPQPWSLARRSQLLLAGCSAILDCASPAFASELESHIRAWLAGQVARDAETAQVRESMRRFGIVGSSQPLLSAVRLALRAAAAKDVPVLILGETGTGKERLATMIHALDPIRSRGPFVAVNCAALSAGLADAEFFGHTRGAFTGAQQARRGLFRAADGGVLLLDEVAELSPALQTKLLRVLQERRVLPVGAEAEVPVDVRVIAATSRSLRDMVGREAFREDLLHRLSGLSISAPPLRERREDLKALVNHIVAQSGAGTGCDGEPATDQFIAALASLSFPGNVRQLENVVHQALLNRTHGAALDLADLPRDVLADLTLGESHLSLDLHSQLTDADHSARILPKVPTLARALEEYERTILLRLLAATGGNQTRIAEILDVTPRTIYNKLKKHGLGTGARCARSKT